MRELAYAPSAGGEIEVWLDEAEIQPGDSITSKIAADHEADLVASNWVKEEWTDAYWEQVNSGQIKLAGVLCRDCHIPRLLGDKSYVDSRVNHSEAFREIICSGLNGQFGLQTSYGKQAH